MQEVSGAGRVPACGVPPPCEVCGHATRERGNGEANLCHLHDPVRQFAARVLAFLSVPMQPGNAVERDIECADRYRLIEKHARSLGLLGEEPVAHALLRADALKKEASGG